MPDSTDLTGQRFGRLVVLDRAGANHSGRSQWRCICDCGNEHTTKQSSLQNGHCKSCGCLHAQKSKYCGWRNARHDVRDDYDTDIL